MTSQKDYVGSTEPPPSVKVSTIQLDGVFGQPVSSASLAPSTVMREQYCFFARMSRREKLLLCAVVVLALVVLGLVVLIVTDQHCDAVSGLGNHLLPGVSS